MILEQLKSSIREAKKFSWTYIKHSQTYYILGAIFLVVGAMVFYQKVFHQSPLPKDWSFFSTLKEEISEFELVPQIADAAGITPHTAFTLKSKTDLHETDIQKHLQFEPQIDYKIRKVSSGSSVFEITPVSALEENRVYSLTIAEGPIAARNYSWAYQVKAPFQVIASLPRDKANGVPTNTGIEITFNRENLINPEQSFEISPSVPGNFEIHRNILIFAPQQELNPKTVYTIKIKAGVKTQGSADTISEDIEIQFETGGKYNSQQPYFNFGKTFWEFKPDTEIAFAVHSSNLPTNTIPLTVYRFGNMQEFLSAYKDALIKANDWTRYHAYNSVIPSADKKVFESNVPLEEQTRVKFIQLPQKLDEGFYLADVVVNNEHEQAWFQVIPIAGFLASSGSQTILWLKDLTHGSNVSGAEISFENNSVGKTNSEGVAMFDTPSPLIRNENESNDDSYDSPLSYFYTLSVGGRQLAVPIEDEYGGFSKVSPPETWWDYLSIDKGIYLPTDKLHFWGIVKQRNGTDIKGEEVTIQLTNPFWYGTSKDEIILYGETKSVISDFYTLTGEISFTDLKPGAYQLSVKRGDEVIVSENIDVETYIKPAYKLTLTADKNAVFAGDSIHYKAKAEFFDGTPVTNLKLKYDGYLYDQISGEIQLNQDGEGSFTVKTEYRDDPESWPRYLGMNISPAVSEEGEMNSSISVLIFGPHLDLGSEQSLSHKTSTFNLTLKRIVLNKVVEGELWWNSENYLGDPVSDWNITTNVEEIIYKRTQIDTGYDVINKTTFPIYQYSTEYKPLKQDTLITDGAGKSQYEWTPEEKKSYRITFTTKDAGGSSVKETHYVNDGSLGFYDSRGVILENLDNKNEYKSSEQVHLQLQDIGGNALASGSEKFIFMRVKNGLISYHMSDSPDYNDNFKDEYIPNTSIIGVWFSGSRFINSEPVSLSFDSNERRLNIEVKKDKDRYRPGDKVNVNIQVTDKDGNPQQAEVNVSGIDEAVFSLNPNEKDITNILYKDIFASLIIRSSHYSPLLEGGRGAEGGGCFVAGTKVLVSSGAQDIESLRIGDEVLTWKEGSMKEFVKARIKRISSHVVSGYFVVNDTLHITMNHRLLVNGMWKHAGEIKIGDELLTQAGVSEKVVSLQFVPEWTLVYNIELDKYHTYFADDIFVHNEEKGGGGARADFRDVAIYKSVRTDSSGRVEVSFDVPDNITSWRLTTQAVTEDLFAGKTVDFVPVGLPFFVETALNRTYLAGDNINLRIRVFGTAHIQDNITYTIESETLPFKKIEQTGGRSVEIPLGSLTLGKHQIKISASAGELSDAIIRDLNVLTSYFSQDISEFYELSPELSNIQGAKKGHTQLLLSSYERGRFYHVLRALEQSDGARIDQKFTAWFVVTYLNRFFGEKNKIEDADVKGYQTSDGGISLLPYSDEDLVLSAKFANLMKDEPTAVDKESLQQYLTISLRDRKADISRIVTALYGLSAFEEPILVTLKNIQLDRNLTLMDKIYVALALDNLGAKEESRAYYRTEIKPVLITKKPFIYIDVLKNQDDNIIATALLAGLSASLSEPEADGLGQYALENYPKETLKNFEVLLYLKHALPKLKGDEVSFSYQTSGGNSGSRTLKNDEVFRLELSADELSTLRFGDINGRIGLVSTFEKASSPAEVKKDSAIGVSRRYSVDGKVTTEFSEGDLVRIDITPSFTSHALEGSYQIIDYLPSGLRAVTNLQRTPIESGTHYHLYPFDIEDQRVTFVIWKNFPSPFFYYARVVSKGNYKAEPTLIQSLKSLESTNISHEANVTVR
ncbi:MAG: hypothetical protein A3B74_03350 [Candidatus Kerfeldbacteria bacterium RIFCSPHIGHO2_02_FULL_42_14]|uniref:Uncharacterized protein n=1 Tax=Candidatus Kerfeldbacteria bacterium RIFCSPHIGHO2_02_FULL_42_14 TaxID=1798540 RepID=A0A1G2AS34_9BACT|nr:MAG: hypothetical protein A3B74_03350 [Candidatus Kerfeldbacteria bacterium RIFCSPHIGHO2_02_FULL_42_14]OGY80942.1 MAG: hypothetical protein A3E60_03260 [Candidatus Kerfeldbacteria bacterium RIFCSPHIGHO2_12_FULL_42_13]OGY84176.1 MAG: hypothetical protein A3I91_01665 [Candidatus Kerfeldbacteria bacterium RIFCSPLOWO2_02_FULL_42_19]